MATEIHRWTLDESGGAGTTIVDQVGSADGTVVGTPDETIGVLGGARYFANNEYINCGSPSDMDFGANDFSIRAIFRRQSTSPSYSQYIMGKDIPSPRGYGLYLYSTTHKPEFYVFFSSSIYQVTGTFDVCDGLYHDVVAVREGTSLRLYVDGALDAEIVIPAGAINDTSTALLYLGNLHYDVTKYGLQGDLDHVQAWSGALTADEVSNLHYAPASTISLGTLDPYDTEIGVSVSGLVSLEIADSANSVLLSTIEVSIDSILAFDGDGGAWQTGYDGPASGLTVSGNGYYLTIDPTSDFNYEDIISVDVYAENDIGHTLDGSYSFTIEQDTSAPVLEDLNPVSGLTGVSRNTNVYLEIYDAEKTVDKTSITIYIDRDEGSGSELAYDDDGGGFQTGYTGSIAADPTDGANRYNIEINPDNDFLDGRTVQVRVVADNTSSVADTLDETYSFTTVSDADSPVVQNADPPNAATNEDPGASIYFEIYDSDVGVSTNSIILYVDRGEGAGSELVWDISSGGWQVGWSGTVQEDPIEGINRFNVTIIPDTEWTQAATISVRVTATDIAHPTPNPLDTTYSFGITVFPSAGSTIENIDDHPVWGDLQISAYGGSGNIVLDSIEVLINDILVYDGDAGGFQPGYDGENSAVDFVVTGYDFTIDITEDLDPESFYELTVTGVNDLGYPL